MTRKKNKPHFHVTAALIWREGKILITRRPQGRHLGGYWEFPGGKQEGDESFPSCLEREIEEELGISVKVGEHLFQIEHDYENKSVSLHFFDCSILKGEPQPFQCDEVRWIEPKDFALYPLPPPDLKIIPFLKARKEEVTKV